MDEEKLTLIETRPTRSDALRNRELLLQTAQRLFAERGVEAVTMSAVAEAAGVGKGTLYRHFPSKSELCEELIDADQRDLQERTLAYLRQNRDPVENLRWFIREVFAFVERNEELLLAAAETQGHGIVMTHPAHQWWLHTLRGLLARCHPALDVDYAADVLYIMLDVRSIHFQKEMRGYPSERILDGLLMTLDRLVAD